MKRLFLLSLVIYLSSADLFSQNNIHKEISVAKELYNNGKYSEASELFEDLYSNKTAGKIYKNYFDCLLQINEFEKAILLAEKYYKKGGKNPSILIDSGKAYSLLGEQKNAEKQFNLAIKEAKERPSFLLSVASKFYKLELYKYALDMYELLKEMNPHGNYSFQISNIYSYLGETENMYKELLELLVLNENYIQTCKNKIRITISEDSENENNILLKKILISKIQKTNSITLHEILIWVFLQENNFSNALKQEISIDKRNENREKQIFDLGEIAMSNAEFEIAKDAFNYITEKQTQSLYYNQSLINSLEIEYALFKESPKKEQSELNKLIQNYKNKVDQIGHTYEGVSIIIDLAHILAFYNNNTEQAKELLFDILDKKVTSEKNVAYSKLKLGDILLIENDIWEAQLYYSQVEKSFQNDVIGHEAKFKKIKIDYYTGKFNWAQAQLDVLKNSTSKLIANNAMELSLLIGDNLNLDTTQVPLQIYAEAELLIFQNKHEDALKKFQNIENIYPNHSLEDNILFHKSNIEIERENYESALDYLEKICSDHYDDILFDDSLYKQAYIFEFNLNDYEKALQKYEELLLKCPSSIFVADARKRYRILREN